MFSSIQFLQKLFMLNCDGDWEHSYGFKIDTLDNPGWIVEIDLAESRISFDEVYISEGKDNNDWLNIKIQNSKFVGCGDITKLEYIIKYFVQLVKKAIKAQHVIYKVYFPIYENCKFWAPVLYRLNENCNLIKINNSRMIKKIDIKVLNDNNWKFWKDEYINGKVSSFTRIKMSTCSFSDSVGLIDKRNLHLTIAST